MGAVCISVAAAATIRHFRQTGENLASLWIDLVERMQTGNACNAMQPLELWVLDTVTVERNSITK